MPRPDGPEQSDSQDGEGKRIRANWTDADEGIFLQKCIDMEVRNEKIQRNATHLKRLEAVTRALIADDPNWAHRDASKNLVKLRNCEAKYKAHADKSNKTGGGALPLPPNWDVLHGLFGSRHTSTPVVLRDASRSDTLRVNPLPPSTPVPEPREDADGTPSTATVSQSAITGQVGEVIEKETDTEPGGPVTPRRSEKKKMKKATSSPGAKVSSAIRETTEAKLRYLRETEDARLQLDLRRFDHEREIMDRQLRLQERNAELEAAKIALEREKIQERKEARRYAEQRRAQPPAKRRRLLEEESNEEKGLVQDD